jgi:hypothetical protein
MLPLVGRKPAISALPKVWASSSLRQISRCSFLEPPKLPQNSRCQGAQTQPRNAYPPCYSRSHSKRCSSTVSSFPLAAFSRREMADLEDRVCGRVAQKVRDPVLGQTLQDLQWLHKKVSVSSTDGSLQILLRPPSLLHPLLDDLKENIRNEAEQELRTWLNDRGKSSVSARVSVQVLPAAPVSMMARLMDDPDELVKSLGPGLANVTHFLAVYSCKV